MTSLDFQKKRKETIVIGILMILMNLKGTYELRNW